MRRPPGLHPARADIAHRPRVFRRADADIDIGLFRVTLQARVNPVHLLVIGMPQKVALHLIVADEQAGMTASVDHRFVHIAQNRQRTELAQYPDPVARSHAG